MIKTKRKRLASGEILLQDLASELQTYKALGLCPRLLRKAAYRRDLPHMALPSWQPYEIARDPSGWGLNWARWAGAVEPCHALYHNNLTNESERSARGC